jgi:hypothetical protein
MPFNYRGRCIQSLRFELMFILENDGVPDHNNLQSLKLVKAHLDHLQDLLSVPCVIVLELT